MQSTVASSGSGKSKKSREQDGYLAGGKSPTKVKKEKRRKQKSKGETYTTYIYRMLKSVHPQMGMATKAMLIMNSFMVDAFERIAMEAQRLCTYNRRETLTDREIRTAVRLGLPGELASHAIEDGMRAVTRFHKNSKEGGH